PLFRSGPCAATARGAVGARRVLRAAQHVAAARAAPPVADADAVRALLEIGARAHGVGTLRCFRDYFRLKGPAVRTALDELVEAGTLRPVTVRGWDEPTYLHADAALPRRATATTLLNPFDPLVFERTRLERLFDVHYRIEIYVPAAKRVHGYYVLPFLEGEALTARVDLKADRRAGVLRVQSAHREQAAGPQTAARLAAELHVLGRWLGVPEVDVAPVGDLAPALAAEVAAH
ncbi:MAG: DNA glycosylase AlkZ-like family protein, partial [Cellulosimicrobium funkei]